MNTRTFRHTLLVSMALCFGLALPTLANAQTQVSDVVVTARRVEERLQDVPASISVLNQVQLRDRNIFAAADLATYTPSLTAAVQFGSDSSSFVLRGFSADDGTSPSVGEPALGDLRLLGAGGSSSSRIHLSSSGGFGAATGT